jgi:hypothetical protein
MPHYETAIVIVLALLAIVYLSQGEKFDAKCVRCDTVLPSQRVPCGAGQCKDTTTGQSNFVVRSIESFSNWFRQGFDVRPPVDWQEPRSFVRNDDWLFDNKVMGMPAEN